MSAVRDAGRSLDAVLPRLLARADQPALVQELAYGTLRWAFQLEALLGDLIARPLRKKDGDIAALLLVGLYQLLYLNIPPHAAVNETVAAAAALRKSWAKQLVNAVLRRAAAERTALAARCEREPALRFNHPRWLIERIRAVWPQDWEAILEADNRRPPMSLRVNLRYGTRAAYLERLTAAELAAEPIAATDAGLRLAQPVAVERLPGFAAGLVSVQDGAAQLAAPALDPQPGERLLDACAAPGGKAAHLLERCRDCTLIAVDRDRARLGRLRQNLRRLGLEAQVLAGDAGTPARWWDGAAFDRILLDAPCSGSGVIRRHPDIKHLRRPTDLAPFARAQARLLAGLWPLLRPGGKLLYVTCSILPEENEQVVHAFAAGRSDARARPLALEAGRALALGHQILPGEQDLDGFYYALLEKRR